MELLFDSRAFNLGRQSVACAAVALLGVEALLRAWRVEDAAWRSRFRLLVMALAALLPLALWLIPAAARRPILLDTALWGQLRLARHVRLDLALAALMLLSSAAFLAQEVVPMLRLALGPRRRVRAADDGLVAEVAEMARVFGVPAPPLRVVEDPEPYVGVRGVRRPRLVLSTGALRRLDADERRGAVAHELAHVERRDTAYDVWLVLLRLGVFFNPFAVLTFRRAVQDAEMAADELASRRVPEAALGLASSLAKFYRAAPRRRDARRTSLRPAVLLEALEDTAHRRLIEERIERLLRPRAARRPPPGPIHFVCAAVGLGAVLCLIA